MSIMEDYPRLSSRLLLSLYDEHALDLEKLQRQRKTMAIELLQEKDSEQSFSLDYLVAKHSITDATTLANFKLCYKSYIGEVSKILDSETAHKNAARTLHNIISTSASKEFAYSQAVDYFGSITKTTFDIIYRLSVELARTLNKSASSAVEFGVDIPLFSTFSAVKDVVPSSSSRASLRTVEHVVPAAATTFNIVASAPVTGSLLWLFNLCDEHVKAFSSFFSAEQLVEEILKLAKSKASEDVLQMKLFELIGENGFGLMSEIIQNIGTITSLNATDLPMAKAESASRASAAINMVASDTSNSSNQYDQPQAKSIPFEQMSANQKRKHQQREQKMLEKALKESQEMNGGVGGGGGGSSDWLQSLGFTDDYLAQERALGLQKDRNTGNVDTWMDNLAEEGTKEYHEKRGLPAGSEKKVGVGFEEINIPAANRLPPAQDEELIAISSLEGWAQLAFPGTKSLNRIQSKVFPCAYNSSENMLLCAPTGAGKTNVAMCTFLQLVKQHIDPEDGLLDTEAVKAVYIAPMKALAQEVVAKFAERLEPLGLVVKEFTGDMQLTRKEVAESNLLVCTPEKYDVVTRKGGDGSLGTLVSLVILDEVHLLAEDRGAVIETIVARTQRYVESSQRHVRLVGLSATLPNYADVATFLKVNPRTGLHYFGPEYRPIPLAQCLIGVTEKNRMKRVDFMNRMAFEKAIFDIQRGKQVMIFVHSRKDTGKTAQALIEIAQKLSFSHLFENHEHEHFTLWKRAVDKSRSVEVQQLFHKGFGVHHAGMLRSDRTLTEQMFESGVLKVLCCTSTLAWGVNLPAHTVIIKGTELYDPERGGFVDISVLDVLQIFGRAGRPQYDNSGQAVLITPHASLNKYIGLLMHQAPIESALVKAMEDHLNAEIVNGTISNIREAAAWLSYTFLFVRMCKNPVAYGLKFEDVFVDASLEKRRTELVEAAAERLDDCMMCRYDKYSGNLAVTDLGRVASHYYIKNGTIEAFNHMLSPHLNEADALHVLCSSAEFDQLKVRPEEVAEISQLNKQGKHSFVTVRANLDETAGKVNVLLQGHLENMRITSFTLLSDANYVAQNASRITRALFEISLKRGWSTLCGQYLSLAKAIDRRMRPDQTPLRQFQELPAEVIKRLEESSASRSSSAAGDREWLLQMSAAEVGQLIRNNKYGSTVLSLARKLPHLHVDYAVQPITRGILKLALTIVADFEWADRYHGASQSFWILVEDGENEYVYHSEQFTVLKRSKSEPRDIEFTIPIREPIPPQYYVRVISDMWVGCESAIAVSFKNLLLPTLTKVHTNLLDMHPIPKSALGREDFVKLFPYFSHFNPIQTQCFYVMYHTNKNALVGAPTGSGKTIAGAELPILKLQRDRPGAKTVYVAPMKALARERLADWTRKFSGANGGLKLKILELTGDITPDSMELKKADILVVTPEKWDSISRGWQHRDYVKLVELMIIDEIHLLGVDRGPVLEVIVSRMRFIAAQTSTPIRFVGLSTALANPGDLADWLGVDSNGIGVFNFRPSVRPIPMSIYIKGFPGKHYCPRMATMNKPTYAAIQEHSPHKPALVFVSSRRQTRLTALDLIAFCACDEDPKQFLHMPEEEIQAVAQTLSDGALRDTIVFGVAIHHAGLSTHDRQVVEELYLSGKVQVLVCTSTLAWGVNFPCHLVVVKGTEFFDGKQGRYVDFPVTDVLQMMGRAGRPQFDKTGTACIFVDESKKNFYKKFLHEPFPVESSLHKCFHEHLNAEIATGSVCSLEDAVEYITWTYLFRRIVANPSYYQVEDSTPEGIGQFLRSFVASTASDLQQSGCIKISEKNEYSVTYLGHTASYYYLDYRTVGLFQKEVNKLASLTVDAARMHAQQIVLAATATNSVADVAGAASSSTASAQVFCPAPSLTASILALLSNAYEFSELPVRHCEDEKNEELAQTLGWKQPKLICVPSSYLGAGTDKSNAVDWQSAHVKTCLLLHAHLSRTALPISDYINDTKSVLDQLPRVLNALVDIAAQEGHLFLVLEICRVAQLISQGCTDGAQDTAQLPGQGEGAVVREALSSAASRLFTAAMQSHRSAGAPPPPPTTTTVSDTKKAYGNSQQQRELVGRLVRLPTEQLRAILSSHLGAGGNNSNKNSRQRKGGVGAIVKSDNSSDGLVYVAMSTISRLPHPNVEQIRVRRLIPLAVAAGTEAPTWTVLYNGSSTAENRVSVSPLSLTTMPAGAEFEMEVSLSGLRGDTHFGGGGSSNKKLCAPAFWVVVSSAAGDIIALKRQKGASSFRQQGGAAAGERSRKQQGSSSYTTTTTGDRLWTVRLNLIVPVPAARTADNDNNSSFSLFFHVLCDSLFGQDIVHAVPLSIVF